MQMQKKKLIVIFLAENVVIDKIVFGLSNLAPRPAIFRALFRFLTMMF